MLVSIKHNPRIVAKVVNPLGTVVTVPNDQEDISYDEQEEAIIHENCDEALFRPVVGAKPICQSNMAAKPAILQSNMAANPAISQSNMAANTDDSYKNKRYQGLKSDEIVHKDGKKKGKLKKEGKKSVVEQLPVKELCNSLEKILFLEENDENKEMWSSVEKLLPENTVKIEEDTCKEMWSSVEHCKMSFDEITEPNVVCNDVKVDKFDDDGSPNNNSSETTESDDSAKIKPLVSVTDDFVAEDSTANIIPIISNQTQKNTKKKAKKKRK